MKNTFVFVCALVWYIQGTALWVTTTGDDDNDCTAVGQACSTIRGAYEKGGSGNTITIGAGLFELRTPPIIINATTISYGFVGNSEANTIVSVKSDGPIFMLTPNAGGTLTLQTLQILLSVSRQSTLIQLGPSNLKVSVTHVTVTQTASTDDNPVVGAHFISIQSGDVVINQSTFTNFTSDTVVIYVREPNNNSTVIVQSSSFTNIGITYNNAIFYDYGWNQHFAHTNFTNVTINNITHTFDTNRPPPPGAHPGLIDVDLIYCELKAFVFINNTLSNLKLGPDFSAPLYFSVEWLTNWATPTFQIINTKFINNIAGDCGGIGVDSFMTKDVVRLNISGCTFTNNTISLPPDLTKPFPGSVTDLFIGGISHANVVVDATTCSSSCNPRTDSPAWDPNQTVIPDCAGTDLSTCASYTSDTVLSVAACTAAQPCDSIIPQLLLGVNNTINIGTGSYLCPIVIVNALNIGYKLVGQNSPFSSAAQTRLDITRDRPGLLHLHNYIGLYLVLTNFHFIFTETLPDWLIVSMSQFGWVNLSDIQFSQSGAIDTSIRVAFVLLYKGNLVMNTVRFQNIESYDSLIVHEGFAWNSVNLTNVNFTNIQLSSGQVSLFSDLESEEGALASYFTNVRVENITRERSAEHGYNFALLKFSGTAFAPDRTPPVVFTNCTFLNNFIITDSLILFSVPKRPVFVNCTFINNTARYAGAISALATGAFLNLSGCKFDDNKGSIPMESFSDVSIGPDAALYAPWDFVGSCSCSCPPKIVLAPFLPQCTQAVHGYTCSVDSTPCAPHNTTIYVSTTGNNSNDCLSLAQPCLNIAAALYRGVMNFINISAGTFDAPGIVIRDVQSGYTLNGSGMWGVNNTTLNFNYVEHMFELEDYPFLYLFISNLRFYLNASSANMTYLIHISSSMDDDQGSIWIENVTVSHAPTVTSCHFVSMNSGNLWLRHVLFHEIVTGMPIVACLNHFWFRNNSLDCENVTIMNVTLTGRATLFDSGGFTREWYVGLLLQNFTATLETNQSYNGLFQIGEDVSNFNIINSAFRKLNLSWAYNAPIEFRTITNQREYIFANITFTNNTAERSGGICMDFTARDRLNIFECKFFFNTALVDYGGNDIFFSWNTGLYSWADVGQSCSRSCAPRVNWGRLLILPNCEDETDVNANPPIPAIDYTKCVATHSTLIFVSPTGNDNGPCTNFNAPCLTIQGAINQGHNNEIFLAPSQSYVAPHLTLDNTTGFANGYSIIGEGGFEPGSAVVPPDVTVNAADTIFSLTNAPGAYLFLEMFRLVLSVARTEPIIVINPGEGQVNDGQNHFEADGLTVTQLVPQALNGLAFVRFHAGSVVLRGCVFTGLIGAEPLISFQSTARIGGRLVLEYVNITNIKTTGQQPLYLDDDRENAWVDVELTNINVENIVAVASVYTRRNAAAQYGLFQYTSNSQFKWVNIQNAAFRYLNLGSAYFAPVHFQGVFGENRTFFNCTFAHNTGLYSGGISDASENFVIHILFSTFFSNAGVNSGSTDLALGTLSDTYTARDIIATCGNSGHPRISTQLPAVENLVTYCDEPVPPVPPEPEVQVQTKTKVSGGIVALIVILILLVIGGAAAAIALFIWYRKKKQQGYDFIDTKPLRSSPSVGVNSSEFEVEERK